MKANLKKSLFAIAAFALLLTGCGGYEDADADDYEGELEREVTALRADYDALRTEFDTFREEMGAVREEGLADEGTLEEESTLGD